MSKYFEWDYVFIADTFGWRDPQSDIMQRQRM